MSAQLSAISGSTLGASSFFTAHLTLDAGVRVNIDAPTFAALGAIVAKLQPTEPANDAGNASAPAATVTVPAGSPASQITAPSARAAAAPVAAEAGNASAITVTPASAQHAAAGSAPAGEAGNAAAASPSPAAAAASTAFSSAPAASPAVSFDELKKAFLGLSTKADGRAKCEGVLKPLGLAKLSAAAPEQYAALLAEIQKASA